jgi:hypothetical protein
MLRMLGETMKAMGDIMMFMWSCRHETRPFLI